MAKNMQVPVLYFLIHLGLIFFMYPRNIIESTDSSHWIPILIAVLIHFIMISLFMKGLSYFPGQSVIMIFSRAGKVYSLLFLLPLCLYFFMALVITVRAYSEVMIIIFLSKTPLWCVMALLLLLSTYLALLGIQSIFRASMLFALIFIPSIFLVLLFSLQNVDWYYLLPIWYSDFHFLSHPSYFKSLFAVGGGYLFLGFVQPALSFKNKDILIAAICIAPFFFISVYIPILTFGQETASTMMFPFAVATDAVNINWLAFDRITVFFLLCSITFLMLFLSISIYITVKIVNHYVPIVHFQYLVAITVIFTFIFCLFIPNWSEVERIFGWNTGLRLYVLFITPLSLLFLGIRAKKNGGKSHV
ncbi:GerAB/ArcD/ProY family transporter [Robertmurraya massiliosenegalensis]|uniref:GerAB/ArcD/ProY family transporter n=1 Tax=Robertmurraya TaxID=2837507 RepID=UPI0039A6E1E9